jgi:hypothetical protein
MRERRAERGGESTARSQQEEMRKNGSVTKILHFEV